MLELISGKVAWITGAGTGIGRAAARALAGEDVRVVLSGRRREELRETADLIAENGGEASLEILDVTDRDAVQAVGDRINERYGRLDILVNNAGTNIIDRHWDAVTPDKWDAMIAVNLNGAFYCTRTVLPIMRARKDGLIINISSWAGKFHTYLTGPAYSAAKNGLVALNASINIEECIHGIRACVICPGEVWTPIMDRRPIPLSDEVKGRMLKPGDLGEVILFVSRLPRHVCCNEILISPTWNRSYVNDVNRPPLEE